MSHQMSDWLELGKHLKCSQRAVHLDVNCSCAAGTCLNLELLFALKSGIELEVNCTAASQNCCSCQFVDKWAEKGYYSYTRLFVLQGCFPLYSAKHLAACCLKQCTQYHTTLLTWLTEKLPRVKMQIFTCVMSCRKCSDGCITLWGMPEWVHVLNME